MRRGNMNRDGRSLNHWGRGVLPEATGNASLIPSASGGDIDSAQCGPAAARSERRGNAAPRDRARDEHNSSGLAVSPRPSRHGATVFVQSCRTERRSSSRAMSRHRTLGPGGEYALILTQLCIDVP